MTDYDTPLREQDVAADPFTQFTFWYHQAEASDMRLPEAAALASASADGAPSVRMVLVKHFDEHGFVFYTNYLSRKGHELDDNPRAALLFHWDALGRQVRITGPVEHTSMVETEDYARSRSHGSQLSALASPQSRTVASRDELERRVEELAERYGEEQLPVSSDWGGFRLHADTVEFWQQRHDRLHDRLLYRRGGEGGWALERLAP